MSLREFLNQLQQRVLQLRSSVQKSQPGRLRVLNLEDRRLLDATAGFLGTELLLDGFLDLDSLTINQDVGGHLDFDLSSSDPAGGKWGAVTGPGLSVLNAGQRLRLDAANVGDLESLGINAANADLTALSANAELELNSLQIQNGGNVQLGDLTVDTNLSINADSISDLDGSQISIVGEASFAADSISLGDHASDTTSFGSVTFVASGAVSISEDSATELSGASSAGSLTLTSSGALTNAAASSLNVAGAALLTADSIDLAEDGGRETNFGLIRFAATNDVAISEASDLTLSGNSTGASVSLTASGNLEASGAALITSDSLSLTAQETALSAGGIGSNSQDVMFAADNLMTSSDGDQFLASSGTTSFTSLQAVDSSVLFDADTSATISLNAGDFTGSGTGVTGGLFVADGVRLASDGSISDVALSATSDITFRIESTAGATGGTVGAVDQWQVTDSVQLGSAELTIADQNLLADGTEIRLIDNSGTAVAGTFSGLAEGDTVTGSSGQRYRISYVGGDGNDVTLTSLTSTFSFAATTDTVAENVVGGQKLVTVNRSGDLSSAESVTINIASGTAVQGTDFGAVTTATASFGVGQTFTTVAISITNDNIVEADETLTLQLATPTDGFVDATAAGATLTITNDDVSTVSFQFTSATVAEGDSGTTTATYQVSSSLAVDGGFSVAVSSSDLQAVSGTDYVLQTSSLSFAGTASEIQTVTVQVMGETLFESDEGFDIVLGSITAGNTSIVTATSFIVGSDLEVSLINDDTKSLAVLTGGNLVIKDETASGEANDWTLGFDSASNEVVVTSSTANLGTGSAVAVNELRFDAAAITGGIVFDGQGGDDVLKIDYRSGNPIVGSGLTFLGGAQGSGGVGDGLSVIGDGVLNAAYTPDETAFGSGTITVGGSVIQFEGLEPVDLSGFATATLTLPGAADVLTITNGTDYFSGGTNDALRLTGTSGGVAIEAAAFWNNTNLVIDTVASGADGVDLITVASASGTHSNTNLSIDTGSTVGDEIQINGAMDFDGNISFVSDEITVNTNSIVASGNQTFTGKVVVDSSTTLTADTVTIGGTVDSASGETNSLSIDGDASFSGNVGSTDALSALIVSGTSQLGGNVSTTAQQSYGDAVTLTGNAVLSSVSSGNVKFSDTVDGAFSLTVNTAGTTQFTGAVGSSTALESVTTDSPGATTLSGGSVTATGSQNYQDSLILTTDAVLTGSTVQLAGVGGGGNDLTIDGDLNLQSNLLSVKDLDVSGESILNGNLNTTGRQDFRDDVVLQGNVTTSADRLQFYGSVDGDYLLNASGGTAGVQFDDSVGDGTALSGLTVSGSTVLFSDSVDVDNEGLNVTSVSTTTLAGDVTSSNGGTVVLNNGGQLTLANGIDLQLDGAFQQTGAGAVQTGADTLTTGDAISFASAVSQTAAVALRTTESGSSAGANITLQDVTSASHNLTLDAGTGGDIETDAITNAGQLTVVQSASTAFQGAVSATTIAISDTVGAVVFEADVVATNLQTAAEGYSVLLLEDSTVTNAVVFSNTGGVEYGDSTGDVQTFDGGITSTSSMNSVQGTVQTSADNLVLGQTTLSDTTSLLTGSAGGNITVGQIDGGTVALTANAGTGLVDLSNSANVIGDLAITAQQATVAESDNVTQSTAWSVTNDVWVSATAHDILLTNPGNVLGDVTATANNVQLTETGDITVDSITAVNAVQLTSSATINDASADNTTDITAASAFLSAASGIASGEALELESQQITATTISGDIDLQNTSAAATVVQTLSTSIGAVSFAQTGTGNVSFQSVSTSTGSIDLSSAASDLTVSGTVIAGAGHVAIAATTGDVDLEGVVSAVGRTVTVSSGDTIEGDSTNTAADIVADQLVLSAVNGIGIASPLETNTKELAVTTTGTGSVSLVNLGSVTLAASSLTDDLQLCTAAGDITISGLVNAAGQTVLLQSDSGLVVETAGGGIVADQLGVNAATGIVLSQTANNVDSFTATAAAGDVRFVEANGFEVTTIAASGCFDGATGVTSFHGGVISLAATTGPITVEAVVQSEDGAVSIAASDGIVTVNENVGSNTADVSVTGNQLQQAAAIATGSAGNLSVVAADGDVVMTSAATMTTDTGSINVAATGDANLASVNSVSGTITITADSGGSSFGAIQDSNGGSVNLATTGTTVLSAGSGIAVDTSLSTLNAAVTGTGNVTINETDAIVLTNITTTNGSIDVTANGELTATAVQAGSDSADSVSLGTTTGNLIGTDVAASGQVLLDADSGNVIVTNVVSTMNGVTVTADFGDIQLDSITANSAAAVISLTASGNIVDSNTGSLNLSAATGTVTLSALNIGSAGSDVFKPTAFVPIEVDAVSVNVTATGSDPDGMVALHLLSDSAVNTVSGNHVFLSGDGDLDLSASTPVANSLSVITTSGVITLPTSVTVTDDLRLEAANIFSVPGPIVDLNADRILFVSGSSANLTITATEFDGKTDGDLSVSTDTAVLQLTDLNCDLTSINTNGATATLDQTAGGRIHQQLPADVSQNSRVLSDELLLIGTGTFELTNTTNNVATLAADVVGPVAYTDLDSLAVGTVNTVAGISTTNENLLLQAGQSVHLQHQVDVGAADAAIVVGVDGTVGNVNQDAAGSIRARNLGVRNEAAAGDLVMAAANDVDVFAAANSASGGAIVFQDSDEATIGVVAASSIPDAAFAATTGVQTNNGNVTIASGSPNAGADSLLIDETISAGDATVRLVAAGDVNQSATGVIAANALGVRQVAAAGDVLLDDGNFVNELAVENLAASGTIGFHNQQSLTVGTVAASTSSASPNPSALQFAETAGLSTNDGIIQLSVDGPLDSDGAIQLDAAVNAGSAGIGISSDGSIQQTASSAITASDALVRQQGESSGHDVSLGAADNNVDNLAISNASEAGDVFFNDLTDLTVTTVSIADVGNISIADVSGVNADAGDINLTSTLDLNVDEDINAASDTSTTSIDETITLISRSGNFTLADGTMISTDENPAVGIFNDSTGDRIHILAGTDGTAGVVDLGDPNTIEIRTDGGLAKQIAPRPTGFTSAPTTGAETAFVTLTDASNSRQNLTFQSDGFLGELEYVFGIAGEENLEVVVDWGVVTLVDLTANGVAGDATLLPSGTYAFDQADGDKSIFYIDEGGLSYQISHVYDTGDLITTTNDRNGRQFNPNIIGVRFSVAQHESINIWGSGAVDPNTSATETAAVYTGAAATVSDASGNVIAPTSAGLSLLSSTDTNGLRNLNAEASTDFPLQNQLMTSSGKPEGLAEWEFIAGPSPGIILFQPTERYIADFPDVVAPIDANVISDISGDAFFGDGAASDASVGTDVYLQIRRYFELDAEAEIVIARINDSDLISSREAFEAFVAANPELQDGAGYEVWLVTETGGQRVERPVVEFEVTGGRPGPPTESILDGDQPVQLQDVEFQQADGEQVPVIPENSGDAEEHAQPVPPAAAEEDLQSRWIPQRDSADPLQLTTASLPGGSGVFDSSGTDVLSDDELGLVVADSGAAESTAVAGVAAASYSAVSRFQARRNALMSDQSITSRTMRSLRGKPSSNLQSSIEGSS